MKYLAFILLSLAISLTGCAEQPKPVPVATAEPVLPSPPAVVARIYGFYQSNCVPCRQMYPKWDAIAGLTRVHVKRSPALARKYKITQTPTTLYVDASGNVLRRVEGYVDQL